MLDGELVAFGADGRPSFPLLSLRVLHGRALISVVLLPGRRRARLTI